MQTLTLEPHEVTLVLKGLAELPYKEAVALMNKIVYQSSVQGQEEVSSKLQFETNKQ